MPQIIITNLFNKTLSISGKSLTLLDEVQRHGLDWMHACGGKGRCTTCKAQVVEGSQHLGQRTSAEEGYMKRNLLQEDERLSCQATVKGDVVVRIPDTGKFPHIDYSD